VKHGSSKTALRYFILFAGLCTFGAAVGCSHQTTSAAEMFSASASSGPPREVRSQASSGSTFDLKLPLQDRSVRFAVIGDSGTGERAQYEVAQKMETYRQATRFDFVIMLGDNIYGNHSPQDFVKKFEQPYKPLLDAGVKFYASLGNHDDPNDERLYKPFNMGGERYYTFHKGAVAFFALDSNYMDPVPLNWLDQKLKDSRETWKICFFHHPLYNDGHHHGADVDLRTQVLPLFQRYDVNAVFSGHEHVYQRIKPENDVYFFVLGNSGKLMTHDFRGDGERLKGFDMDQTFMLVEISGDELFFQTISRTGETIDFGELPRNIAAKDTK
jgi:DNA repair exonuclease SbcCD nuclease subunit